MTKTSAKVQCAVLSSHKLFPLGHRVGMIFPFITWLVAITVGLGEMPMAVAVKASYVQCSGSVPNPVILKGKRFFDTLSGKYFPIKGIAYYPRPNDGPLSVSNSVDFFTEAYKDLWMEDIANLKDLGVNTIRIYAVDPSQNHDAFMCELRKAGIYAIIGLLADCEDCAIGPFEAPSCYPAHLKERGQYIINEFSKYSNTLAFEAGNEVTLFAQNRNITLNAPCQKKFIFDMRSYVNTCSEVTATILPRKVPIGMVNWDDGERAFQASYFNCQTTDPLEMPEWYGMNVYQHCDPSATSVADLAGWIKLRDDFASLDLAVPVFPAEYGCREPFATIGDFEAQRNWLQVDAMYSEEYQQVFAGGVAFEYSAEKKIADTTNQGAWPYYEFTKLQYGIGYYSPVDCDHTTTPCSYNRYPEFDLLAIALDRVDVSFVPGINDYLAVSGAVPTCPDGIASISDFVWPIDEEPDLPCYVLPTMAPTMTPSISPTMAPHDGADSSGAVSSDAERRIWGFSLALLSLLPLWV